jgi:hypothetical protein
MPAKLSGCGAGVGGLITRKEYDRLDAYQRGYAVYWQGDLPGSELKDMSNRYPVNTKSWSEFERGQMQAMLDAQDSEE